MIHFWTYETAQYKVENFHHGNFYDFQKLAKVIMNKKHDLSKLCNQIVILAVVHEWYSTLPTSARAVDTLPASTIDDSGDDDDNTLI